jgi:hypothetical protein
MLHIDLILRNLLTNRNMSRLCLKPNDNLRSNNLKDAKILNNYINM